MQIRQTCPLSTTTARKCWKLLQILPNELFTPFVELEYERRLSVSLQCTVVTFRLQIPPGGFGNCYHCILNRVLQSMGCNRSRLDTFRGVQGDSHVAMSGKVLVGRATMQRTRCQTRRVVTPNEGIVQLTSSSRWRHGAYMQWQCPESLDDSRLEYTRVSQVMGAEQVTWTARSGQHSHTKESGRPSRKRRAVLA